MKVDIEITEDDLLTWECQTKAGRSLSIAEQVRLLDYIRDLEADLAQCDFALEQAKV